MCIIEKEEEEDVTTTPNHHHLVPDSWACVTQEAAEAAVLYLCNGTDQMSSSSSVLIQALGPYTDTHNTHTPKTRTIQNSSLLFHYIEN